MVSGVTIGVSSANATEPGDNGSLLVSSRLSYGNKTVVYAMNSRNGSRKRLYSTTGNVYDMSYAPNGRGILFSLFPYDGSPRIMTMTSKGNKERALTSIGADDSVFFPQWKPGGGYTYERLFGATHTQLLDGNGALIATTHSGDGTVINTAGPYSFSRDGTKVVFERSSASTVQDRVESSDNLYIADSNGANARQLTQFPEGLATYAGQMKSWWSRNGSVIFFLDGRDHSPTIGSNLYRITPDGTDMTLLRTGVLDFAVAPNGRYVVIQTEKAMYRANKVGAKQRRIAKALSQPIISPDSRRIAFTLTAWGGRSDVGVMTSQGRHRRFLTNTSSTDEFVLDWQRRPPKRR